MQTNKNRLCRVSKQILIFGLGIIFLGGVSAKWNDTKNAGNILIAQDWNDFVSNIGNGGSSAWGKDGNNVYLKNEDVGIGTNDPTERLEVKGNIKADKFIDKNDKDYYLDPSEDSNLKNIKVEKITFVDGTVLYSNTQSSSANSNTLNWVDANNLFWNACGDTRCCKYSETNEVGAKVDTDGLVKDGNDNNVYRNTNDGLLCDRGSNSICLHGICKAVKKYKIEDSRVDIPRQDCGLSVIPNIYQPVSAYIQAASANTLCKQKGYDDGIANYIDSPRNANKYSYVPIYLNAGNYYNGAQVAAWTAPCGSLSGTGLNTNLGPCRPGEFPNCKATENLLSVIVARSITCFDY
jgi:hypothetical protein